MTVLYTADLGGKHKLLLGKLTYVYITVWIKLYMEIWFAPYLRHPFRYIVA